MRSFSMCFGFLALNGGKMWIFVYFEFVMFLILGGRHACLSYFVKIWAVGYIFRAWDLNSLHDWIFINDEIWKDVFCAQMLESTMFSVIDLGACWDGACNDVVAVRSTCRNQFFMFVPYVMLLWPFQIMQRWGRQTIRKSDVVNSFPSLHTIKIGNQVWGCILWLFIAVTY